MDKILPFAKERAAELLFLIVASSALFSTIVYGFHIDDSLRTSYALIVGWTTLLMLVFTACSYSLRSVMIGTPVVIVLGIAISVIASIASGHGLFDDAYGNIGFFLLAGFIVAGLTFMLTRKGWLSLIYLIAGTLTCGLIQFLYLNGLLVNLLVFLVASTALYVCVSQKRSASELAQGAVSAPLSLGVGALLCCTALVLSSGVYFGIVAPLNPPAQELKLITKYYALEEVHISGYSKVQHLQDENLKTEDVVDGSDTTNKTDSRNEGSNGEGSTTQGVFAFGINGIIGALRYFIQTPLGILFIPLVALLIAVVIFLKKYLRKRRFEKMCALDPPDQIKAFYLFFEKRLALFGIKKGATQTPMEHAQNTAASCAVFETGADGATFAQLAQSYCESTYGRSTPDDEALDNCKRLYQVFYRNACQSIGKFKYAFTRFFRI